MIFLTGGTGFLGMSLIARLLDDDDGPDIVLAVRARDAEAAGERVRDVLATLYDEPPDSAARLRAVPAELTEPGLGLRPGALAGVERIVHCAASISFTLPLADARAINVDGTRHVLDLARRTPSLERLVHVSTAYVAGRSTGRFGEGDLDVGQTFRNTYEQTKAEAERLLAAATDLPAVVVRPSIVVGESDSGWTSAFNVIYWPLQAYARGLVDEIPADPRGIVDLVPVDHVTSVLHAAAFDPGACGTYHAVSGDAAPRVSDLMARASELLDRPPPRITHHRGGDEDHPTAVFAPYFDVAVTFDDRRARTLAGAAPSGDLLATILDYARATRWGKRPLTRQGARATAARSA